MSAVLELQEKKEVEKPNRPTATSGETAAMREVQPLLFADVLLEVDGAKKRRLGFAAISSALLQSVFVAILLIVPLMFTEALPSQQLLTMLVAPPPPPPPPPPAAAAPARVVQRNGSDLIDGRLRTPGRIPQTVKMIQEEEAPPVLSDGSGGVVGGVPGGIPGGQIGGVLGGILGSVNSTRAGIIPKLATPARPERVRISQGVTRGQLISKIEPKYPLLAREARVQGDVILRAIISRSGEIENLQLLSGHPMLVPSALDAVKQWRYRPFLLNGEPVEVETTITVTFALMQ
jgi:periplasmic protein TonB